MILDLRNLVRKKMPKNPKNSKQLTERQADSQGQWWDVQDLDSDGNSHDGNEDPTTFDSRDERESVASSREDRDWERQLRQDNDEQRIGDEFNPERVSTLRAQPENSRDVNFNELRSELRRELAEELIQAKDAMMQRVQAMTRPVEPRGQYSMCGGNGMGGGNGPFDQTMTTIGPGKVRDVREFHKGLEASKQLTEWRDWHDLIEMALNTAEVRDQSKRANHLTMAVGDEVRVIIKTRKLYVKRDEPGYPYYDELVKGLEEYFREISDPLIENLELRRMKQKARESPRDWYNRVVEAASRVGGEQDENVRTTWCDGLYDEGMKREVFTNKMTIEAAVTLATRHFALAEMKLKSVEAEGKLQRELIGSTAAEDITKIPMEVHAVKKESRDFQRSSREQRGVGRSRSPLQWRRATESQSRDRWNRPGNSNRECRSCGFDHGRDDRCPARNVNCRTCGKVGHFARKCRDDQPVIRKRTTPYRRENRDESGAKTSRHEKEVNEISDREVKGDSE